MRTKASLGYNVGAPHQTHQYAPWRALKCLIPMPTRHTNVSVLRVSHPGRSVDGSASPMALQIAEVAHPRPADCRHPNARACARLSM
jgi:hypothetical protein